MLRNMHSPYIIGFIRFLAEYGRWDYFNALRSLATSWCCVRKTDQIRYGSIHTIHGFRGGFSLNRSQPSLNIARFIVVHSLHKTWHLYRFLAKVIIIFLIQSHSINSEMRDDFLENRWFRRKSMDLNKELG